jgi:hypothetical protein
MKTQDPKAMVKPRDNKLITNSWHDHATNNLLLICLFEFMKLVQLTIVQAIGNVGDEKTFSTLTLTKFKL